ncbi:MAG: DUF58 domain-containing protein [Myxococcota bacterium]|nr:DUF58 domain-containing protein [Myxococcota bacterium]
MDNTVNEMGADPGHLTNDDPALWEQAARLQLVAQSVVDQQLAGIHLSPHRGQSIEFSEHRHYQPGDDPRKIDWRAFGKTNKLHVKEYENETRMQVHLALDHSGSMGFPSESDKMSKFGWSKQLFAVLAYMFIKQGDAVSCSAFNNRTTDYLESSSVPSHLGRVLRALTGVSATGPSDFGNVIHEGNREKRRPTLNFFISDFFSPMYVANLNFPTIPVNQGRMVAIQVLSPQEIQFAFQQPTSFKSLEGPDELFLFPMQIRKTYLKKLRAYNNALERHFHKSGAYFFRFPTQHDLASAVTEMVSVIQTML